MTVEVERENARPRSTLPKYNEKDFERHDERKEPEKQLDGGDARIDKWNTNSKLPLRSALQIFGSAYLMQQPRHSAWQFVRKSGSSWRGTLKSEKDQDPF